MARYMRGQPQSYGHSHIYAPVVVNTATVFAPSRLTLVAAKQVAQERVQRRAPHSILRKPAVVAAAVTFPPVSVHLAPSKRGRPKSSLRPPAVVAAATTFRPPQVTLSGRSALENRRHNVQAVLQPPAVVGSAAQPPVVTASRVTLAAGRTQTEQVRRAPSSSLRAPAVVAAAVTFRPIEVTVSVRTALENRRHDVQALLRPPAVVSAATQPPVVTTLRVTSFVAVNVQSKRERWQVQWTPINPAIINPATTFPGPEIKLAPSKRGTPKSFLRKPGVVGTPFVAPALRVTLTRPDFAKRAPNYQLRGPATLAVATTPPVVTTPTIRFAAGRTQTEQQRRAGHSKLRSPAVVAPAVTFRPEQITTVGRTAIEFRRRDVQAILRPPTVVNPAGTTPPVVTVERITLAAGRTQTEQVRRAAHSKLRAPAVVAAATVFRAIQTKLAPSKRGVPKSKIRPPAVVDRPAFFGPKITLAPLTPPKRGKAKSQLRAPAVVAAARVFRAFTTKLAGRTRLEQEKRKQHSELNPPATQPTIIVTGMYDGPGPGGDGGDGRPGAGMYDQPDPRGDS